MTPKAYLNQAYRLEQRIKLDQDEINTLLNKCSGGTTLIGTYHWSSTEYSHNNAWYVTFDTGLVGSTSSIYKEDGRYMRFLRYLN